MNQILANVFVAFGITFSIVFPSVAPAYLWSKEFRKNDWNVKLTLKELKKENTFDVIIIGAGIGGLTCGALLSKRGYRVLILEQGDQAGGYCVSFKRKGFVFNAGVIDVGGLQENGPLSYLLKQLDFKKEDYFVRNTSRYIFNNKEIYIPDTLEETVEVLTKHFGVEKESVQKYFKEVKLAYEECYKDIDIFGAPLPPYLIAKTLGSKKLQNFPNDNPHFYNWLDKTFIEKLNQFITNEQLKSFLCGLSVYTGTSPEDTPALLALTAWMGYFIHGGYFTKGGAQNFVSSVQKFIENNGGVLLVKQKAAEIIVQSNQVKGVRTKGDIFHAPVVVANVNAKTTFLELVGEKKIDKQYVDYIKNLPMSFSCFVVYLE